LAFPAQPPAFARVCAGFRGSSPGRASSPNRLIGTALVTFASPSKTLSGPCGPFPSVICFSAEALSRPTVGPDSSHRVSKDRPSTVQSNKRQLSELLPKKGSLWCEAAKPPTCSILVVSHHRDGLLRLKPHRFIAPCCRPWGSLRFRVSAAWSLIRRKRRVPYLRAAALPL
jgi:hypothetical protein